jgi:hypothetical protein
MTESITITESIEPAHKLKITELGSKKFQNGTDEVVDGNLPTTILIPFVRLSDYFLTNIRILGELLPRPPFFSD